MDPLRSIPVTNLDSTADSPAAARGDLLEAVTRLNRINTVAISGYSSNMATAIAAIGSTVCTLIIDVDITVSDDLVIPNNIQLSPNFGTTITISSNKTLTINSPFSAGIYQVFAGSGVVSGLSESRPEWFGTGSTAFSAAINSLVAGGRLILQAAAYVTPYIGGGIYAMQKTGVTIQGAGKPSFNSTKTGLEGGTIIQGPFVVMADNFAMSDLGFDSGVTVTDSVFSGAAKDAFAISNAGVTTTPLLNFRAQNVTALCRAYNSTVHAFLVENVDGFDLSGIDTMYGEHGFVIKSRNGSFYGVYARDHATDGLIIKSDSYANAININGSNINIEPIVTGHGGGLRVQGVTAAAVGVNLNNIRIVGTSFGIRVEAADGYTLSDSIINNFTMDTITGVGLDASGNSTGVFDRVVFANGIINNTGSLGAAAVGSNFGGIFQNIKVTNPTLEAFYSNITGGKGASFQNCEAVGLATGKYALHVVSGYTYSDGLLWDGTGAGLYKAAWPLSRNNNYKVAPTLLNSWDNVPGLQPVAYYLSNGKICIEGAARSGVATTIFNLPYGRPGAPREMAAIYRNGATVNPITVTVYPSGDVAITALPGGFDYVSLDGLTFLP